MGRLLWLADELRAAGLTVREVDDWKVRGSETFDPIGVTWHATAGSRTSSAQGEVNVILNGSATAPPPIAQLMIYRDGVVYVCAAGRCNHNKVGWAGPNEGLGNSRLLGIEMANDNKGEPWPARQLDAARRATAAIFRRFGTDPRQRLAGHYEHQPYAGRPPGETSTKTDPHGVRMADERARVAALLDQEDEMPTAEEIARAVWTYQVVNAATGDPVTTGAVMRYMDKNHNAQVSKVTAAIQVLAAAVAGVDEATKAQLQQDLDALQAAVEELPGQVVDELGEDTPEEIAIRLRAVLGDKAAAVGALLAQA